MYIFKKGEQNKLYIYIYTQDFALLGSCGSGPRGPLGPLCVPLGSCGLGSCGAPWAVVGPLGPVRAGPFCDPLGYCESGPCGLPLGPNGPGPPWVLMGWTLVGPAGPWGPFIMYTHETDPKTRCPVQGLIPLLQIEAQIGLACLYF